MGSHDTEFMLVMPAPQQYFLSGGAIKPALPQPVRMITNYEETPGVLGLNSMTSLMSAQVSPPVPGRICPETSLTTSRHPSVRTASAALPQAAINAHTDTVAASTTNARLHLVTITYISNGSSKGPGVHVL